MKSTARRITLATLAALAATAAQAAGMADTVSVATPYVRLTPPGARTTAAFMTLKNNGESPVTLIKAESGAAKSVELHAHIDENGMMKMRQVTEIAVKAKGETALKPGGYHIMLINPAPLKEGEKVTLTLRFSDGSSKAVDAPVTKLDPGAEAPDHSHHDHHH